MKIELEVELSGPRDVAMLLGLGIVGAVVTQELRKAPAFRTWHGQLGGLLPYDLRPPTVQRVTQRLWDPDNPALLVGTPFGVGWTVNLGRLIRNVTNCCR